MTKEIATLSYSELVVFACITPYVNCSLLFIVSPIRAQHSGNAQYIPLTGVSSAG